MPTQSLRFGRFELQPRERRLLVDGAPAAAEGRHLDDAAADRPVLGPPEGLGSPSETDGGL